jgi:hypothetical protein
MLSGGRAVARRALFCEKQSTLQNKADGDRLGLHPGDRTP